ncbi:esterase family protein [Sphingobacterium sp. SGG-5]|uniref:alpha/beta hydrolase n=1 Tax=Sphingobacterium sp. SGG-5 TaxID=2710881 RepID=UPI0013EC25FD|nr:alpha/beta hydrolase family protein [Sphingobacterium sp. SGG-5]NGM61446.1 esterase family protein [Sphingobacterium sp. SGG-5]
MKHLFGSLFLLLIASLSFAAKVDTVEVYSAAMKKKIKTVVISPENNSTDRIPTLYLLHGFGGNYSNWVLRAPHIKNLVDQYNYRVVCPDGGHGSWYWDIPGNADWQYETFVSKELISFVEQNYPARQDRNGRAIAGLSMGGHGALYLAINHQDTYGAAGSTAGGVDIRPFPNNWDMAKRLGPYSANKSIWESHTVMELLHLIEPKQLKLFIDCGTDDFFYAVNQELHKKLTYMNVPHAFMSMPGKHNWDYWRQSIVFQMAFFNDFFHTS